MRIVSDVAEVKEAIEYWREGISEGQSDNPTAHMIEDAKHFNALADAARRWVRLVETGEVKTTSILNVSDVPLRVIKIDGPSGRYLVARIEGEAG